MKDLFSGRSLYVLIALLVIGVILLMAYGVGKNKDVAYITATADVGSVQQLVSVSGVAEAEQTAELAFPVSGIVKSVLVEKGDEVQVGDVLIELNASALEADRQDALATLAAAVADRDELIAGPTSESREVTSETILLREEALATTLENEARKIENARRTLLSSDLTAVSNDDDEDAVAPTITGTYICEEEGVYIIDTFPSGSDSGYSYRLTGIESGTFVASVTQNIPLGDCGLRIIFDANSSYSDSTWEIHIPNTKSSQYTSTLNAYNLTVTQAESAIALAEQDLALAEADATNANAPARSEAVARANAAIAQAQARVERIDASLADTVLTAPFSGTVTEIDILPGETVTTVPVVTLLASEEFEVIARIPEIDIGKLLVGQTADMVFDARSQDILSGQITFISLKSTEIDGVAYYEATITLDEIPVWLRSGLNADIDVIIDQANDVIRIPKRFLIETDGQYSVLLQQGDNLATTSVDLVLAGNDGWVALSGITSGTTVVAP